MRYYNENAFSEAIDSLKRNTGDTACVTALEDMIKKLNNKYLVNKFN